jgi:hypothetical protein
LKARRLLPVLALAAGPTLAGCGKIGPIRPPLALVPQRVDSLEGRQLGGEIVLAWTNPAAFNDGRPLGPIAEVEVWMDSVVAGATAATPAAFDPDVFLGRAKLVASLSPDKLAPRKAGPNAAAAVESYRYPIADKDLAKVEYVFAIRVREAKRKKFSPLSNEVRIKPRLVPMPPRNPAASVFSDRVEIRWDAPLENIDHSTPALVEGYNIYKLLENALERKLNEAPVAGPPFADRNFAFGVPGRYVVRAVASTSGAAVESLDSQVVDVVLKDTFPPAVPDGATAVGGPDLITLIWNPNRELDLLGYKVWRRLEAAGEFVLLTPQPILENTYADPAVEKGKRYEYAISAVDRASNESARSAAVSAIVKDP